MKDLYLAIEEYAKEIDARIQELEKAIANAPKGNLRIRQHSNGSNYYNIECYDSGKVNYTYVAKSNTAVLIRFAKKKYAKAICPVLKEKLIACNTILNMRSIPDESELREKLDPALIALIPEFANPKKDYCKKWTEREYPSNNQRNMEDLKHMTLRGDLVRSKSEAMIADALYRSEIPYMYEYPLLLPGRTFPIYPDFTILRSSDLKELYWEHFGCMDIAEYSSNFVKKMHLYSAANIEFGKKLIASFETQEQPLSSNDVERIIQKYILYI